MRGKSWLSSKTIRFNAILVFLAAMLGWMVDNEQFKELISSNPDILAWVMAIQGVVNVILRFVTKEPIISVGTPPK